MDCQLLKQRYEACKSQRRTIEQIWQVITKFVAPFRGDMFKEYTSEHEVEWRQREIYDSTAVDAAQTLAANLHGALTSPSVRWFDIRFRQDDLNKNDAAITWLTACAEAVWYALQDSNFNLEANESYFDLVTMGTAVIVEEELQDDEGNFEGIDFSAMVIRDAFFEEDHRGDILRFYRRLKWSPSQIIDKFGEENVPDHIKEKAKAPASVDTKVEVVFAVYPRKDFKNVDTSKPLPSDMRPWGYKYFLHADAELLEEGGYYERPAFIPRWRKVTGSSWGHSPAMVCLSNVLTLNQMVETSLAAQEKVVDPPLLQEERSVMGDLSLVAGDVSVVADVNGVKPLISGANFAVEYQRENYFRESIQRAFFMDQLQLKESPAMTATEVQVRYELMQRLLGPTLGRLQSDYLDPMIERTFRILWRAGQLPEAPQAVIDSGAELDITYLGPMSRAQKLDKLASNERWVMQAMALAEIFPEAADLVDIDGYLREQAEALNTSPEAIVDEDTVKGIRQRRRAQQAQQAEMMNRAAQGEAMEAEGKGVTALKEAQAA